MPSERKKLAGQVRQDSRKARRQLVKKQNGKCFWCNKTIIDGKSLQSSDWIVVKFHQGEGSVQVKHKLTGVSNKFFLATIDHVKPVSIMDPIDPYAINKLDNLVASCAACNKARTATPKSPDKKCKDCGRTRKEILEKEGYDFGKRDRCRSCRSDDQTYWLMHSVTRT